MPKERYLRTNGDIAVRPDGRVIQDRVSAPYQGQVNARRTLCLRIEWHIDWNCVTWMDEKTQADNADPHLRDEDKAHILFG